MEMLARCFRKDRKRHSCGLCGRLIEKGERYEEQRCIGDGGPYVFRSHERCQRVSNAIWDYVDPDNGMTQDEFCDAVNELMSTFFCPFRCDRFDRQSDGFDCREGRFGTDCIAKFDEYLKTHELVLDTNRPWAWRMKEVKPT